MTEAVHQASGQSGQTHQSGGVIRAIAFICLAHPSVRRTRRRAATPARLRWPGTGRQRPAFPNTGYSRAKRLLAYFAARGISQREATSRAWTCHSAPRFPSEIRTAQAAIKFVNSLDPKTRAKLHWKLAASALAALDTGAIRQGAYDRSNRQCATLWRLNAGWPTEVGEASHADARPRRNPRGRDGGVCAGGGTPQAQLCPVSGATRKSFARSGFTGFDPERTSGSLRWRSHSVELVTIALRRPGSRQSARPPSLRAPPLRARQSSW